MAEVEFDEYAKPRANSPANANVSKEFRDLAEDYKYSKPFCEKVEMLTKTIRLFRGIRGDGSCFYRSVIYAYLERIVAGGQKTIAAFLNEITGANRFCNFGKDGEDFLPLIKIYMNQIKKKYAGGEAETEEERTEALKLLFKMVNFGDGFDRALIRFLRYKMGNFLKINYDLNMGGIDFQTVMMSEASSVDEYIARFILEDNQDAKTIAFNVCALVLRTQIDVVILDAKDAEFDKTVMESYNAITDEFDYTLKDGLDWHKKSITVLLKPGHYDLLYTHKDLEEFPAFGKYDRDLDHYLKYGAAKVQQSNEASKEEKKNTAELEKSPPKKEPSPPSQDSFKGPAGEDAESTEKEKATGLQAGIGDPTKTRKPAIPSKNSKQILYYKGKSDENKCCCTIFQKVQRCPLFIKPHYNNQYLSLIHI
eukprot:TRINITY_DN1551_c0_g2_i1.p1 TRINITY_DN1551_c0_g2~~TRINITY_DN1551_c0_g2_i1.p1  ORF type:complete len:422 (-),score=80.28 TRINITY_DN1551_c0_g2_i1:60-1325(-)